MEVRECVGVVIKRKEKEREKEREREREEGDVQ